jgi:hypothetical protein
MITFSKLGQLGRLGNQLFQYAALRGLSVKKNFDLRIPDKMKSFHGQEYLMKNFSIPENFFSKNIFFKSFFFKKYQEEKAEEIDKNFYSIKRNTDIKGYFQSIFYFGHCIDIIKKELTPKGIYIAKARNKFNELKAKYNNYDIVSLHLRRGDNVDPTIEDNKKSLINSYGHSGLESESFYGKYLISSKSVFKGQKVKFLVFSGGGRKLDDNTSEIDWCKKNLIGDEYIFIDPQKSFDDFCLISQCDANIISPASSFGWWAAFLNFKSFCTVAPFYYDPSIIAPPHRYMFYPKNWKLV